MRHDHLKFCVRLLMILFFFIGCKRFAGDSAVKDASASANDIGAQCKINAAKCIPHMMIATGGSLPCSSLYDFTPLDAKNNLVRGGPTVWAFDEVKREYHSTGRMFLGAFAHDAKYNDWPPLADYQKIARTGYGQTTPAALKGLPIGLKAKGAPGKAVYRPVAYVVRVTNQILNGKDYWVVFRTFQTRAELIKSYDDFQQLPEPDVEVKIRKGEYCVAAYSVPVDSGGKFNNGQPKLNTPLDAANFVIDPLQSEQQKVSLQQSISLLSTIPGVGSALSIQAGCSANEGSCSEAIGAAIADGAMLAIPAVDVLVGTVKAAIWVRRTAAVANGTVGLYDGFKTLNELQKGNMSVAASYGFQAVFRLGAAGMFELSARQSAQGGMDTPTAKVEDPSATPGALPKALPTCPPTPCALSEQVIASAEAPQVGMKAEHLKALSSLSQKEQELIILREGNPASLPYQGKPGYRPKPMSVKLKTAKAGTPHEGLVVKPTNPSASEAANIADLEGSGWSFDKDGVLRDPQNNAVHSDYDLQSVQQLRMEDEESYWSQMPTNRPDVIAPFNEALGGSSEKALIQHGANDNYVTAASNQDAEAIMGRTPGPDERFVVLEPGGKIKVISGTDSLRSYYLNNSISWPYAWP